MTRQLRDGKGKTGLVLANGGWVTYQHVVCLSRSPRSDGLPYPDASPLPKFVTDVQVPKIAEVADGDAIIEVSPKMQCMFEMSVDECTDVHCRLPPQRQTGTRAYCGQAEIERPEISRKPCRRTDFAGTFKLGRGTGW